MKITQSFKIILLINSFVGILNAGGCFSSMNMPQQEEHEMLYPEETLTIDDYRKHLEKIRAQKTTLLGLRQNTSAEKKIVKDGLKLANELEKDLTERIKSLEY